MSATIHAAVNILPELARSFGDRVEMALDDGVITLLEVADPLTPVDTGALRANKLILRGEGQREIVWNQHYAIYQEFGTTHGIPAKLFATQGGDAATEAVQASLAQWGM